LRLKTGRPRLGLLVSEALELKFHVRKGGEKKKRHIACEDGAKGKPLRDRGDRRDRGGRVVCGWTGDSGWWEGPGSTSSVSRGGETFGAPEGPERKEIPGSNGQAKKGQPVQGGSRTVWKGEEVKSSRVVSQRREGCCVGNVGGDEN